MLLLVGIGIIAPLPEILDLWEWNRNGSR